MLSLPCVRANNGIYFLVGQLLTTSRVGVVGVLHISHFIFIKSKISNGCIPF